MAAQWNYSLPTPVAAGSTPLLSFQILDQTGAPVPAADLTALTLSLVDTITSAVVNGVSNVNILNTGRGTVDAFGNVSVQWLAADMAVAASSPPIVSRTAIVTFVYNAGAGVGVVQVNFFVQRLA